MFGLKKHGLFRLRPLVPLACLQYEAVFSSSVGTCHKFVESRWYWCVWEIQNPMVLSPAQAWSSEILRFHFERFINISLV